MSKSWGGMHLCCTLATLPKFREWYRRKEKPFAMMVRDMDAVERFSSPNQFEKELLLSSQRPIVLVSKREPKDRELISPGLGNIGIFLPYTEMQHLLFSYLPEEASDNDVRERTRGPDGPERPGCLEPQCRLLFDA